MESRADLTDDGHGDLRDERGQQDHKRDAGQDREEACWVVGYSVRQPLHPAVRLGAVHCLLHGLCTSAEVVRERGTLHRASQQG